MYIYFHKKVEFTVEKLLCYIIIETDLSNKLLRKKNIYSAFVSEGDDSHGVVTHKLNYRIMTSEFETRNYVHFWTNSLGKTWTLLSPHLYKI